MSLMQTVWRCTFSPRLYKIYEFTWLNNIVDRPYEPKSLERWGDQVITSFVTMWSLSLYTFPLMAILIYRRITPVFDFYSLTKFAAGAGLILVTSLVARGYSRASNPLYTKFIKILEEAKVRNPSEARKELNKYDFEFWANPVDFQVAIIDGGVRKQKQTLEKIFNSRSNNRRQTSKEYIAALPCKIISYVTAHTIAVKLMYPGSISFINWILRTAQIQGRSDLIKRGAERFKIGTSDGNYLDTIFINRKNSRFSNGDVLVITCEGNCGFYETGVIGTPISCGYSVLGWNHPGFANSTGAPYPAQEENAIDCVLRFAIDHLGFPENKIILYGWSIGGYTATWAAMNYPTIKSMILDATFDDVLPLATSKMPLAIENIVRSTIRQYLNLNIAEQLIRYKGTVLLIRRTEDEMVCAPSLTLSGNRGNILLAKLLMRRYPHVFSEDSDSSPLLTRFLNAPTPNARKMIMESVGVSEEKCIDWIVTDLGKSNWEINYPSDLGHTSTPIEKRQLALFLATKYMVDQASQHCVPLENEFFHPGWDPSDYEKRFYTLKKEE
ncbi:phosphatidylserine lipase ABHD16A [Leptopilina boulardi]|uniref:phosphatidylserine lipase ABHD16A n=1 Tax=Leptopilina boulardi TaxID=63433 RepID=UPI0021F530A5|nr:phosphatidylserine lipase ABHD16A [Leptopilina boulardi]